MLTRYGAGVGLRLLRHHHTGSGIRHMLAPVNYWRTIEFRVALREGDFAAGQRVLDIGSPKLLAIYLADKLGCTVHATDLDDYFLEQLEVYRDACGVSPQRLVGEVEDARALSYADASFDRVLSISVLEHIGDEDADAAREIARVLGPGGRAIITVPFDAEGFDVRRPASDIYWADPSLADADGNVFFEHRYSESELHSRLIDPSGLDVAQLGYIGEVIGADKAGREVWERLPRFSAPVQPLVSKLLHRGPAPAWTTLRHAKAACLVLTKPAA